MRKSMEINNNKKKVADVNSKYQLTYIDEQITID